MLTGTFSWWSLFQRARWNVCRDCGRVVSNSYGASLTPALRLNVRCDGSEASLGECRYSVSSHDDGSDAADTHHCTHSGNHVAVDCRPCLHTSTRSRRNPVVPYYSDSESNSSSGKSPMPLCYFMFSAALSPQYSHVVVGWARFNVPPNTL